MNIFKWYFRIPLFTRILCAFALGILGGIAMYYFRDQVWTAKTVSVITPFGTVLVSMLKMVVIPIIFFSLVDGVSSLSVKQFGKLGINVIVWYFLTSLFAAVFGCLLAKLLNPTMNKLGDIPQEYVNQLSKMRTGGSGAGSLSDFITSLFANPFEALAGGQFLPVIVFALLFGIAARCVADTECDSKEHPMEKMLELFRSIQKACFKIIDWILEYFPIGIFSLTLVNFARYGTDLFGPYMRIIGCVVVGVFLMILFIYPFLIFIFTRQNPYVILWKCREPILTAFLTRSSSATLPVSLRTADHVLHIKRELSSFALPLGATINMDGVCVHLPVFAILAANMFQINMSSYSLLILVISITFAAVGAGGIPGGSVFLLFMVLANMGLTDAQTMLIAALALGVNPVLDMFETACNVAGDNVCNYIIAKRNKMLNE